MKPYRPSIRRLQLEFAQRLARRRMMRNHRRRHPDGGNKALMDNSEPWLEQPDGIADYWYVADQVNQRVEEWGPRQTNSSAR